MADRCLCHAYFEGVYDKQIKQGQDLDLAQGVRAIDGYGNEVDFTYEPTEIDLCKTGDQEVTYKAFGASFNVIPKLCMPKYKKGVSIPEACPSDLEMITAKRIIRIIRASNPRFLGIPRVTITENEAFDPTEGVTAVDDNGNTIDFNYEGKYDLVAEGDGIASFETEYEQNAKAVEVALEPIQDLNGYDKPWSGGAGVNVLDPNIKFPSGDKFGLTVTTDGYNYKFVGTATSSGTFVTNSIAKADALILPSGTYYFKFDEGRADVRNADGTVIGNLYGGVNTINEPFYIRNLFWPITNGQTYSTENFIAIAKGSTAPTSWAPYSNICPISGHTEVDTEVCGVNVWDEEWELGNIANATGTTTADNNRIRCKNYIPVVGGQSYYFFCGAGNRLGLFAYDNDKAFLGVYYQGNFVIGGTSSSDLGSHIVTLPTNCKYIKIKCTASYGATYNNDISINYPSTDHDYHAYQGNTYTTTLGRTVYGGTLDVVSGELVVDRAMVDLGTLNWQEGVVPGRPVTFYTNSLVYNRQNPNALCSHYQVVSSGTIDGTIRLNNNGRISVIDSRYTTLEDFKNAVNGVQLVYELATPTTIQLTPQQVELLKGTNNVWSEEGGVRVIYEGNIPQDGSFEYPLEGEYTITYKATDKCGNEGTAERTIVVTPSE